MTQTQKQHPATTRYNLGPGFWPFTACLTIAILISIALLLRQNIDAWLPDAGTPAGEIDGLFKFMGVWVIVIFYIVAGYTIYFSIVFRRRKTDPPDAVGVNVHGSAKLEFWWTAVPTLIIIVLTIYCIIIWRDLQATQPDAMVMEATGHQFAFAFRYPSLNEPVANDLHVPVETPIMLNVTSVDVIHGFWVPALRLKMDMVPGLVQTMRFTPTHVGTYRIICSEYCGRNHGDMVGTLHVDSAQEFAQWIAGEHKAQQAAAAAPLNLSAGQASAGQQVFGQKCAACHTVGTFDQRIVGPGLGHLMDDHAHPTLVDGDAPTPPDIAKILQHGFTGSLGTMPNQVANALTNQDIANLVAYLVSLSGKR